MSQIKYQELILEAIDQLRRRKARPDAERIYNCLFRRKGIGSAESKVALEKCVDSGAVLRVCYKGNISYRNAAKKYARQQRRSQLCDVGNGRNRPRRKFANILTNAFAELVLDEPDNLELGVPPLQLINTILEKDSVRYTKKYVWILLQKEVENGGLIRLESGNFTVGKPPVTGLKQKLSQNDHLRHIKKEAIKQNPLNVKKNVKQELYDEDIVNSEEKSSNQTVTRNSANASSASNATHATRIETRTNAAGKQKRGFGLKGRPPLKKERLENMKQQAIENQRVGGRRKKAKKVFDPSESNMPKRRGRPLGTTNGYKKKLHQVESDPRPESRTSSNGRTEGGVCSVCHIQNKKEPAEKMICCRECSNKAHASCLNGDDMMLKMYPDNTWQCPHCKTCVICYETSNAGTLVVCAICADAYHNACHIPNVTERVKPNTKWMCNNCQMPEQLAVDNIQIGYNMDVQKCEQTIETSLSRNSSPHYASSPTSPTLPTLSPQNTQNGGHHQSSSESDAQSIRDEDVNENIDPSIPDASNWSAEEVTKYFSEYFPQEAQVFKDQEIDGHSLLLMRRMDVLKGLQLKLGPALKIYRHVLKLQYRRDDPKLYWV